MMLLDIYIDTLVFGIQKFGGVSNVWNEYIKRMLNDSRVNLTLLNLHQPYVNPYFRNLNIKKANFFQEKRFPIQILRNVSPTIKIHERPAIFQSTYLRVCNQKNIRNVVMIHDVTHQKYFSGLQKWMNSYQKRSAINSAGGIICVSENTKRDIQLLFPNSRKIKTTVIYNSANESFRPLIEYELPEKYKEIKDKKYIIYVGDRFSYKNISFLYKILSRREDVHLVLIGGKELSDAEVKMIDGNIHRVHLFRGVTDSDLNILYNHAFCLIYPSLYEGFGIPILEAMRTGCPVIAFNNSSIPEVLRGSGFLVNNNDLNASLYALEKLEDNNFRDKIAEAEIKASNFFSWDRSYEQLISFYSEILR